MKQLENLWAEWKDALMTNLANRTFKHHPNLLDRLALTLVRRAAGPAEPPDPELEHAD